MKTIFSRFTYSVCDEKVKSVSENCMYVSYTHCDSIGTSHGHKMSLDTDTSHGENFMAIFTTIFLLFFGFLRALWGFLLHLSMFLLCVW